MKRSLFKDIKGSEGIVVVSKNQILKVLFAKVEIFGRLKENSLQNFSIQFWYIYHLNFWKFLKMWWMLMSQNSCVKAVIISKAYHHIWTTGLFGVKMTAVHQPTLTVSAFKLHLSKWNRSRMLWYGTRAALNTDVQGKTFSWFLDNLTA